MLAALGQRSRAGKYRTEIGSMELITECHPEVKAKVFEAVTSVCGGCDFIYDNYYSRYLPETHYATKCGAAAASSGGDRLGTQSRD